MYFNSLRSNARGIAILVKDSCPITNVSSQIIFPGNLTRLNFTYKEETWSIAALYAPDNKDLPFFTHFLSDEQFIILSLFFVSHFSSSAFTYVRNMQIPAAPYLQIFV